MQLKASGVFKRGKALCNAPRSPLARCKNVSPFLFKQRKVWVVIKCQILRQKCTKFDTIRSLHRILRWPGSFSASLDP